MSATNASEKVVQARAKAAYAAAAFYATMAELDAMIEAMKAARNTRVDAMSALRFAAIDELLVAQEEEKAALKNGGAA